MGKLEDYLTRVQSHQVTTEDGYFLTLFRVPEMKFYNLNDQSKCDTNNVTDTNTKGDGVISEVSSGNETEHWKSEDKNGPRVPHLDKNPSIPSHRSPVLLVHGLCSDGSHWFINDQEKTLPYILTSQGYDVWIGSYRGSFYSKGHTTFSSNSKKYWDFGAREIGIFDIPAFIDYILSVTGHKSLYYVGHSFGNTVLYIALALKPEYNDKIIAAACMCPAVYGNHVRKLGLRLGAPIVTTLGKSQFIRRQEVGSNASSYFKLIYSPVRNKLALSVLKLGGVLFGFLSTRISKERLLEMSKTMPSTTSVKLIGHIMQCFRTGTFREYDYGRSKNTIIYGQPCPPSYDLKRVTIPIATFTSPHDKLIPPQDVAQIAKELPNLIGHFEITSPKMSHVEFIVGHEKSTAVFDKIAKIFNETRKTHL